MIGRLTDAELAAMPPKTLQDAEVVEIYRAHPFIEAYAKHTDRRIRLTGYKAAVGSGDNWDSHGDLQRDFLIAVGLEPQHTLLEIGCGTGRLARKIVPYLARSCYTGVDISAEAIRSCQNLAREENWASWLPEFLHGAVPTAGPEPFDFAWAFSVMIHLPPEEVEGLMRRVARVLAPHGRFYWSFTAESRNWRSGLKQFRATVDAYRGMAHNAGLTFDVVDDWIRKCGYKPGRWSGGQQVALSTLA